MQAVFSGTTNAVMARGRATPPAQKDPFAVALGRRIRDARDDLGWTQRQLSREARYDAVQLSRVESGESVPRADALLRLAAALKVPIESLYGATTQPVASPLVVGTESHLPAEMRDWLATARAWMARTEAVANEALETSKEAKRLAERRNRRTA